MQGKDSNQMSCGNQRWAIWPKVIPIRCNMKHMNIDYFRYETIQFDTILLNIVIIHYDIIQNGTFSHVHAVNAVGPSLRRYRFSFSYQKVM